MSSMTRVYRSDPISIVRHGVKDQYNEYGEPTIEKRMAHVDYKMKLIRNVHGEQVVSAHQVLLAYDPTITFEDKIGIGVIDYPILSIEYPHDFSMSEMVVNLE